LNIAYEHFICLECSMLNAQFSMFNK